MEDVLSQWLLENRPYTHVRTRIRQFLILCRTLEPHLSYGFLKRHITTIANKLLLGDVGRLWVRDRCFERVLRLYGDNDQRTTQWHTKRGEMITASEVYKIFSTPEARRDVMIRKLEPPVPSGDSTPVPALLWGTRFEPVAKKLYEQKTQCQIIDVSCVQHPKYPFLGASPDGLIVPLGEQDPMRYGRLVEFKCPMSRAEKPEIPIGYVHQMQLQMECTGIDECEYVEFRFKQVNYTEWAKATEQKGRFAVYEDGHVDYEPTDVPETAQMVYWILGSIKEDFVKKDPNWLSDHIQQLTDFWNEVLEHRKNGTLPQSTKPSLPSLDI